MKGVKRMGKEKAGKRVRAAGSNQQILGRKKEWREVDPSSYHNIYMLIVR